MATSKDSIALSHDIATDLLERHTELRMATSRVELLGSRSVVNNAKSIMVLADELLWRTRQLDRQENTSIQQVADMMDAEITWIGDVFRYDLGVADQVVDDEELERRRAIRVRFITSIDSSNVRRRYHN